MGLVILAASTLATMAARPGCSTRIPVTKQTRVRVWATVSGVQDSPLWAVAGRALSTSWTFHCRRPPPHQQGHRVLRQRRQLQPLQHLQQLLRLLQRRQLRQQQQRRLRVHQGQHRRRGLSRPQRRVRVARISRCVCRCADLPLLTNGFSKKLENHEHALALYFMYYNFCRIHQTLRVTPRWKRALPTMYGRQTR